LRGRRMNRLRAERAIQPGWNESDFTPSVLCPCFPWFLVSFDAAPHRADA